MPPAFAHQDSLTNHGSCVFGNALAVKCGLRHLPLGTMLRARGSDHAFAQQHFRALNGALLDEIVVLHNQHFPDVVGMIQEKDVVPSNLVMRNVAVLPRQVLEKENGVCWAKPAKGEPQQVPLEAGWIAVCTLRPVRSMGVLVNCRCHCSQCKPLEATAEGRMILRVGEFLVRTKSGGNSNAESG